MPIQRTVPTRSGRAMVAKHQPTGSEPGRPRASGPVTESFRTELTQGEQSIDAARWCNGIEDVRAIAPRIRVGRSKWFNILWLLPVSFVALIVLVAIGQGLRGMPAVQHFIARFPGQVLPAHAVADAGIPTWVNWQHFFNMFFMFFIIRSGWQIFVDHPRLYWRRYSKPGEEWLRGAGASRRPAVDGQAGLGGTAAPCRPARAPGTRSGWPAGGT